MSFLALLAVPASAHVPVVYVTTPDEDWCGVIAAALGGDIIQLAPGTYPGPCAIEGKVSDPIGESTIVQSLDPTDPAVLTAGAADHVLALSGVRIVLLQVTFADLPAGVDAVHVADADEMWVRYSTFERLAGAAVRQTGDLGDLTFENNELTDVATVLDLGCDGGGCTTGTVLVEDNLVVGAAAGITFLSPAAATVRDNVMVDVAGTAIRTNGGDAVVEGNLVESLSTAVDLASGPGLLRSNILVAPVGVIANGAGGGIRIAGNTIASSGGTPLVLDGWGPDLGLRLVDNAIDAPVPDVNGASASSNVECVPAESCFTNADAWDFYPSASSLLREGDGTPDPELLSDWCGMARQDPPTPGAMEAFGDVSYGSLAGVAPKDSLSCTVDEPPPGTDPAPPQPGTDPPIGGDDLVIDTTCGCTSMSAGSLAPWMAVAMWLRTRGRTSARRTERPDRPAPTPRGRPG